jgi:DNA-binding NtrC family response regulator
MATDGGTVLVVDDEPLNVDLLEQELAGAGYRTLAASSGEQALQLAARESPDLILLDVMMAGIDGYEACRRLKADAATRPIPVIFLTALAETFEKVRAFKLGAVDYVTKPFEPDELLARVATHIALRREKAAVRMLSEEIRAGQDPMVGESAALRRLREQIARVAPADTTVLIQGETGTGKELVARAIHEASTRRKRLLVKVNCAAIPRELVESELFGHERGAFTGATEQRRGRFELADGGTIFLDEIGELPLEAQAKLLRVLQEREFERVGGSRTLRSDVRVIAATNRELEAQVGAGRFRADLFYRLNVFPLMVPPLRERREDIPRLVAHFTAKIGRRLGRKPDGISPAFLDRAAAHPWPGNIRELENMVERALIASDGGSIDLPAASGAKAAADVPIPEGPHGTLEDVERAHIRRVLEAARWVIEGELGAARILGLNPSTLRGRLRKLGIRKGS